MTRVLVPCTCRNLYVSLGLLLLVCIPATLQSRERSTAPDDPLEPLAGLIGRWNGSTEGQPGHGTVEREYTRILGSRFIQVHNRTSYPRQEKNPKGEVHEDMGVFSFDKGRRLIVLRQFHVEGFVSQYTLDATSKPDAVVFTSETIENISAGWRARETYLLAHPDEIEEIFELAAPGKTFEIYSRNRLKRLREPQ
jgi:hypothetical protein